MLNFCGCLASQDTKLKSRNRHTPKSYYVLSGYIALVYYINKLCNSRHSEWMVFLLKGTIIVYLTGCRPCIKTNMSKSQQVRLQIGSNQRHIQRPYGLYRALWEIQKACESISCYFSFHIINHFSWYLYFLQLEAGDPRCRPGGFIDVFDDHMGLSENRVYSQWNSHLKTG